MKLKAILPLLFFLCLHYVVAQNLELSIFTIPDSLTQKANSVVRFYDTQIELESHKKMTKKVRKAVTVLNKLGNHESELTVYYDKNKHIKSLKAVIYNSLGSEIKKISKNKFEDYAAADGFSLYNDGRLKYYRYVPVSYPYTIYYEYETETSNTAFIPGWRPMDSYNQSIQSGSYTITFAADLKLQKSEKRLSDFAIVKNEKNNNIKYSIRNQPSLKYEEYSPKLINLLPRVMFASNKFHLEGYDGYANNWDEFGKWMYTNLIADRGEIPEATKNEIKNLVKDINDPIEKARKVYEYVQNKTRYISVQVGIGGWMPMSASDVDRLGYGDCKALTNYTKSLLDVAGVTSHYTAVHAGSGKRNIDNDVVSVQGNHVILYIPSEEKDYWLECTSQTTPFGYQGTFTDDRDVLVVSSNGGKIKRTTASPEENNYQNTTASYAIDSIGNISGQVTITTKGTQYDDHYELEKQSKKDVEDYYKSSYWSYLNSLTINNVKFVNDRDKISFKESLHFKARNYASISGNNMLITLNALNKYTNVPKRYRNRKHPLSISRGFLDKDEFSITFPKGYTIETMPENRSIETAFGKYDITIEKISPSKIKYTRKLLIKKGKHPKEAYKTYRKFRKQIAKLDNSKIILTKN